MTIKFKMKLMYYFYMHYIIKMKLSHFYLNVRPFRI